LFVCRFKATTAIHMKGQDAHQNVIRGFDVSRRLIEAGVTIAFVVCWLIGPMAAFDNPIVLNWFYIFGHSFDTLFSAIICAWATYYNAKLRKAIAPALVDCQPRDALPQFAAKVCSLPPSSTQIL